METPRTTSVWQNGENVFFSKICVYLHQVLAKTKFFCKFTATSPSRNPLVAINKPQRMNYIINIPKPCNQKWNDMIPTEKGRFCEVCQKEIYDFTNLSNRELVEKLENNENVCARYRKSQLNTNLYANKNKGLSKLGLLISITSIISVSQQSYGQNEIVNTETETNINPFKNSEKIKTTSEIDSILVKGVVKDEMGPLPSANVIQKGTLNATETNFDGEFELICFRNLKSEKITIEISYIGYESKEIEIDTSDYEFDVRSIELTVDPDNILTGEVVVVKRNIFQRIGNLFKRKK